MTNSKNKLLVVLIIMSSLIGYLEWGGGNSAFLFEMEKDVLSKLFAFPNSVIHPLTIFPMLGQVMLLVSLFKDPLNKKLVYWGIGLIAILLVLILFIGIIELNWKIIICSLPFVIVAGLFYYLNRK
ncbi:MAG: hypothetical protein ACK5UE_01640 [Chitinophagales bacterium]|jgi:hypothetical protein|nr:hypothetical protein [Sphingobacteriales bacterium]